MKLNKYLRSVLTTFRKTDMREDLVGTRAELTKLVLPAYDRAFKSAGKRKWKANTGQQLEAHLIKGVKTKLRFQGNWIAMIQTALLEMEKRLPALEQLVDEHYDEDAGRGAMTVARVNLLQYLEAVSFYTRYSGYILNHVITAELNHGQGRAENEDMIPAVVDWVDRGLPTFIHLTNLFLDGHDLVKVIEDLPDAVVTETNALMLEQTRPAEEIDPFRMGFIPTHLNPIFHYRMKRANAAAERYKETQAQIQVIELKIYNLEQLDRGKNDAGIQAKIKYLEENRLQPLQKAVMEWEEKYGS